MNQRKVGMILSYAHIFLSNTISLIYTPYMLRTMGQSEYGLNGTASSFVSYLSVLSFGIAGAYIRFNAQARAKKDREEEKRLNGMFLTIFSILAVLVLIGGVILIAFSGVLVKKSFTSDELFKLRVLIGILTINMMLSFICNVFMMALQAYEQYLVLRGVILVAGVVQPLIGVLVLRSGGRAIAITTLSFVISVLSYLFFFIYARKVIRFEVCFNGFDRKKFKELFVFSGFLFLNTITDQITFSTDNIILSSIKGTTAVAIYSVGSSFKSYFQSFSTSISSVFAPQINRYIAEKRPMSDLDDIFIRVGRIQFYVVSLILIGYCTIGYSFVRLWAGEDYKDAFYIGLLLMLAVSVPSFQNVALEIQKAKNMHKARSIVFFFIALFNVLMTIPMAKKWSGIGAAAATMACMITGYVVFLNIYNYKRVGINIPAFWKSILSVLPGYIPTIMLAICIHVFWPIDSYLDVLGSAVVISIVFFSSIYSISMNQYEKNLVKIPFVKIMRRIKW